MINKSSNYPIMIGMAEVAYMNDGVLYTGRPNMQVMIEDTDDLATLRGLVEPGTIAFTAGSKAKYQLAVNGTWVDMVGSTDIEPPEEETGGDDTTGDTTGGDDTTGDTTGGDETTGDTTGGDGDTTGDGETTGDSTPT